jgi:class 3 adenylate cyclase
VVALSAYFAVIGAALSAGKNEGGYLYFIVLLAGAEYVFPPEERLQQRAWQVLHLLGLVFCAAKQGPPLGGVGMHLNLLVVALVTAALAFYSRRATEGAEAALEAEKKKTEALLHNVLPVSIANRLKDGATVSDRFEATTVLFADLVGFTPRAEGLPPDRVVHLLDEMFKRFDRLCAQHGLEKIKTIGDAYMAAAGVPTPHADHVAATAELALAMQHELKQTPELSELQLRIGLHTGPVVAGVIGERKFTYDLWGDTVNTASRMESHGVPGRVQVTEPVFVALKGRYTFEPRGEINVKGKGPMQAWLLVGRR